ncbi:Acyl-CoA dehydrogenase [Rhodococcus erythropolis]|uniref:acyl-CoA dehydrogenase family protein n=1 Tax=Rhodococcus erythropolis TaxID=1833 RepID=UPI000BB3B886|nr:acyl-CoA dehydrogenase family protein [Rhodococcus erythropolis]PBI91935.1 Acyl-CoA dehydrogenase [Rhodococcus erythropolis]
MTRQPGWWGPVLDEGQRDLQSMLDAFTEVHASGIDDDPDVVGCLVAELASLGVWTLGTAERFGGGGADKPMTSVVFERLGRSWPSLGWASVQAHAAVDVLGGDERFVDLVGRLHEGTGAVAVVDESSAHVRITREGDVLTGAVDRVDAAAERPHLLVLGTEGTAVLVDSEALTPTPLRRTGFGGAFTRALEVDAGAGAWQEITCVDVATVRMRLRAGAATVAAGLAGAAAEAAHAYAADRKQFGDTLTAIPTVRQSLLAQTSRGAIAVTAALGAEGEVQVLAALREACDSAIDVAASALQSHGGYGYLTEYSAERRLRDAVSLRAAADPGGAALASARTLVGLPPVPSTLRKDAS